MRHITVRDEKMAKAKAKLELTTAAYHGVISTGTVEECSAARDEYNSAFDEWSAACDQPDEHYCAPCDTTHPTGTHGILVLRRAISPSGKEFERSHDLHIVLCQAEWDRLGIDRLIERQLKMEKD